jgi:CBS domain-containing protein
MTEETFIRVGDVMTKSPYLIPGLASVRTAIELMREKNVSSLVIEKRHEGDEFGVVSVHDIASKVIGVDRAIDRTSVYEIMSKPVLTVNAQMNIRYAIRLLTRFQLTRALVLEHQELVGIVTLRDMVVRIVESDETAG